VSSAVEQSVGRIASCPVNLGPKIHSRHVSDALVVGKSSLIVQFVKNQFIEPYYPTIEQAYYKQVRFKGVDYDVSIIDTAGQDEYSLLSPKYAVGIHGYVLVYSVNNRHSFDMVRIVYEKLKNFQVLPAPSFPKPILTPRFRISPIFLPLS
jgi:hypothetical protein